MTLKALHIYTSNQLYNDTNYSNYSELKHSEGDVILSLRSWKWCQHVAEEICCTLVFQSPDFYWPAAELLGELHKGTFPEVHPQINIFLMR